MDDRLDIIELLYRLSSMSFIFGIFPGETVKQSRITSVTIKKYLDYFEDSFLIEAAQGSCETTLSTENYRIITV